MLQIIKQLEIIKSSILIEDVEIIELQIMKLNSQRFDEDVKNKQGMTVKFPLLVEKVWVKPGKSTFKYITTKAPLKAGIDPYNKMIDRIPDDNIKTIEKL